MKQEEPLVHTNRVLEKFPGKGGWTFAPIPEIPQHPDNPFGWVQVRGRIDHYELERYKLMPMGNGHLFLPVKGEIRRKIRKQAGDEVEIVLYADESRFIIPDEIKDCLSLESDLLLQRFKQLPDGEQKVWCDWIYHAKTEEIKAQRIVSLMRNTEEGRRFQQKINFSA